MSRLQRVRGIITGKRVVLLAAGVGVTALTVAAFRPDPVEVETATVCRAPMRVTVDAEGRSRVRDRYVIAAPVSGRLERVPVRAGDVVHAGDVVARIAPAPLDDRTERQARARLEGARAVALEMTSRVRLAESGVTQAQREADRAKVLHAAGAISARAMEDAQLMAESAGNELAAMRARAAAADAEVEQARAALLDVGGAGVAIVVRTPVAGRVLRLADPSERVVAPGMIIAEVGDTRALEMVVDVLSSDAVTVRPGMVVTLSGFGEETTVEGRVRLVEPAATTRISALGVEEQRVDVLVDVPDAPAALGDGYQVDASIVVWEVDAVLTVPSSALVRVGTGWAVFVIEGGRAALREIRVGRTGGATAQVIDGVEEGDTVIVFPSDKVRDGARVERALRAAG